MPLYDPSGYDPGDFQPNQTLPYYPNTPQNNASGLTTPPPDVSPGGGGPAGGTGMPDWLTSLLGGGGSTPLGMSSFLPAMIAAFKHYNDAGKYKDTAATASGMTAPSQIAYDPVVQQKERDKYQQRLDQYYTDPTAFLTGNPEYMATQKLGLGALNAKNAARGHYGDGAATTDELTFTSDLGARFLGKERDDLYNLGGFGFDPANNLNAATSANVAANNANRTSADFLMRGNEQEITAQNNALRAMMAPFGAGQGPGRGGQPGGGPGTGGTRPGSGNPLGGGSNGTSNMLQRIGQLPPGSLSPALFQTLGMIQNGVRGLFNTDPDVVRSLADVGIVQNADGGFDVQEAGPGSTSGFGSPGGWDTGVPGVQSGLLDHAQNPNWFDVPVEQWSDADWTAWDNWEDSDFGFSDWWGDVDSGAGTDWSFGFGE